MVSNLAIRCSNLAMCDLISLLRLISALPSLVAIVAITRFSGQVGVILNLAIYSAINLKSSLAISWRQLSVSLRRHSGIWPSLEWYPGS